MKTAPIKTEAKENTALLADALVALEKATGVTAHVLEKNPELARTRADAILEVQKGELKARYTAEIKRTLHAGAIGHVVAQLQRFNHPMVITRYITPPMAERLKDLDVAFIDTAGNAYLNAPRLFVYVTGRKAPEKEERAHRVKAFRPTGLQVIFALLSLPDLIEAPYRNIAKAAHVALGTVGWLMYDLKRLNYLVERGNLRRKLINKRALLDAWVTAYGQQLRPKLYIGRFRAKNPHWWQNVNWHTFNAYLGGEPAAAKLTGYLKPETVTIYTQGNADPLLIQHHLRKDPTGDIELIRAFWRFEYPWNHPDLAPPLLVYADLLATGNDRNIETGKMIYEKYLARLVGQD